VKTEFGTRFPHPAVSRTGVDLDRADRETGELYLSYLRSFPHRPEEASFFEDLARGGFAAPVRRAKEQGLPVVGLVCNFVPPEFVTAAGAYPVRLCAGSPAAVEVGEEVLPRDMCPLVKAVMGMRVAGGGIVSSCDLVIIPSSCDPKRKIAPFFSAYVPTWVVELPQTRDYTRTRDGWLEEMNLLVRRLREFTGRFAARRELRDIIELYRYRTTVVRRLFSLRMENPAALSVLDYFLLLQASFYLGPEEWIARAERVAATLEAAPRPEEEAAPRVLLTGAPLLWPNFKLPHLVEEAGGHVVADTLCSATQALFDPVEVDEGNFAGLVRAVALRYLYPSLCPCFLENEERTDRILELAREARADGVISHGLRLCTVFDIENAHLAKVLSEKGIPFQNVYTDYGQEDREQLKVRVEAFMEMIR